MALSASIATGLLGETQRAANSIKGELAEHVSLLERAVALQGRLRDSSSGQLGRYIAAREAKPQGPAWSWVPSGQMSTNRGLPSAVAKDQAKREFSGLLQEEIRTARNRQSFEAGQSLRQYSSQAHSLLNMAQGNLPSLHDLQNVGQTLVQFGNKAKIAGRMAALRSASGPVAIAAAVVTSAAELFMGAHELGTQFGKASGRLDVQLRKSFRDMSQREAVDLGSRINAMVDSQSGGRVGADFAARLRGAIAAREKFQNEVIKPILCADPNKTAVALDMALGQAANNGLITRKSPHNLQGRPDAIDHVMKNLIMEGRGDVMSHAAELLKGSERQAQRQRREFDNDPVMAGEFHDEMRRQRKLEKFEYEDKQRDWGSKL